jgi:hypothetical protein
MTELHQKRIERKKETAEDFTPEPLVNEMIDKLPQEVWTDPSKTFLDNSAGNGNFLVAVLQRKLDHGHDPIQALSTIYGVELMHDNVEELHHRMYTIVKDLLVTQEHKDKALEIIKENIVCHDALTFDYENWCPPNNHHSKPLF